MENLQNQDQQNSFNQPVQQNPKKQTSTLVGIIIIIVATVIIFGGVFCYQYFLISIQPVVQTDQTAVWKTYEWTKNLDKIFFEYPFNWIVEKEYYSTPLMQTNGEQPENIGLFIYPQNNKSNNIHIGGRQNSCDASENHSRCISKEGHIIFTDSKNQKTLEIFDLFLTTVQIFQENQTVGWKTYKNDEYGFEFKYPIDWRGEFSWHEFLEDPGHGYFDNGIMNDDSGIYIEVTKDKNIVEDIIHLRRPLNGININPKNVVFSEKEIKINNVNAKKINVKYTDPSNPEWEKNYIVIEQNGINYLLLSNGITEQLFKNIYFTFKFTTPAPVINKTADWKTYIDENSNAFQVSYPNDWIINKKYSHNINEKNSALNPINLLGVSFVSPNYNATLSIERNDKSLDCLAKDFITKDFWKAYDGSSLNDYYYYHDQGKFTRNNITFSKGISNWEVIETVYSTSNKLPCIGIRIVYTPDQDKIKNEKLWYILNQIISTFRSPPVK